MAAPKLGLNEIMWLLYRALGAGNEDPDLRALSAALKTKLRLSDLKKLPPTMSPGVELPTRDVKSCRGLRSSLMDTCPSAFHPCVRTVPVCSVGDTTEAEMKGYGLAALATLATVYPSTLSGGTGDTGVPGRGTKVIATANLQIELPEFDPKNLPEWAGSPRPHRPHPGPTARGWRTGTARPVGGQSGEGERLTSDAPHNGGSHPLEDALPPPPQRATPAGKGARCGAGAGFPCLHRPQPGHTGRRTPAARPRRRGAGVGTAPVTRRPSQQWRTTPPRTGPYHPRGTQSPQGMQARGTALGPHTHTPAPTARGWRTGTARPVGGQSGEGQRLTSDAHHNGGRHTSPGTPFRQPHSEQRRPARAHAVGPVLGPHARTDRTRDTRIAEPRLPTTEDQRPGEGQCLTPGAPHKGGRPPRPGTALHHPNRTQPPQGMQAKGTVMGPHTHTPAPAARGWRTPTACPVSRQSGEGQRLNSDAPHNGGRHAPRGRLSATPTASNAGLQGRTLWGRCWILTPARTAPGTHGSQMPGCPPKRTGRRERDSA